MPSEPLPIGRNHRLLARFRQAFKAGLLTSLDAERPAARQPPPDVTAEGLPPLLPVEGTRLIDEALRSGLRLRTVLFSQTGLARHGSRLLPQLSKHTETAVADDRSFAHAMEVETPQGVAALVQYTPPALQAVFGDDPGSVLLLAAAGVQDPGNLGTLIRAADAFGATGVVALAGTVSPFNPKAVRASAGSLFHLPVVAGVLPASLIAACRERGVRLLAAAARPAGPETPAVLSEPVCLLVGQEGSGVPREMQRAADASISIPTSAAIDSLNAGVAGSILLYEAARQRRNAQGETGGEKHSARG